MRYLVYGLALLLLIAHHDLWLWDDRTLYLGFIPSGLAYHAVYSLVAAFTGFLAVRYLWPEDLAADEGDA